MGRKIGFGFLWFLLIYLVTCMLIGAIAGAIAGSGLADPQQAAAAGKMAGSKMVAANRLYILLGAISLTVVGSIKGFFPGTKEKA